MKLLLLLLLLTTTTATTTTTPTTTTTGDQECIATNTPTEGLAAESGINNLGINILKELNAKGRGLMNVLLSPLSVWSLLVIVLIGAEGNSEKELLNVLGLKQKDGVLNILKRVETRCVLVCS